jgi:hypothetical protein
VYYPVPTAAPVRSGCSAPVLLGIVAAIAGMCAIGIVSSARKRSSSKWPSSYARTTPPSNPYAYAPRPGEYAPPASVRFDTDGQLPGYRRAFYYLGWFTNTSPTTIGRGRVTVVFIDAQGREVLSQQGFTDRELIHPQERVPMKILVNDPPVFAHVRFEPTAARAGTWQHEVVGLSAELISARRNSYGSTWEVTGRVLHRGSESARFVKVEIQALDASGRLLDLQSAYVDGEAMEPGGTAHFRSLSLAPQSAPARFALFVSGRPAR